MDTSFWLRREGETLSCKLPLATKKLHESQSKVWNCQGNSTKCSGFSGNLQNSKEDELFKYLLQIKQSF